MSQELSVNSTPAAGRPMKESGQYSPEEIAKYDYFTLLLPSEY